MGMHRMTIRWLVGLVGFGMLCLIPPVWAADPTTGESVSTDVEASHEHILQTIEATRLTDPALAAEMERQLGLFESGAFAAEVTTATPSEGLVAGGAETRALGAPGLIGPPVEGGEGGLVRDPRFEKAFQDPRMEQIQAELQSQMESGGKVDPELESQARDILKEYGVTEAELEHGREGEGWHEFERGEGFERAWSEMSTEAREQMERFDEGSHEVNRETFEREWSSVEAPERSYEYEASTVEREVEYQAPEREMEYQAPEPEQDYQMPEPPQEYEMPQP